MCEISAARLANTVLLCCSEWDICGSLHGSPQDTYTNSSRWRSNRLFNSLPSFVNSFLAAKGRWTASVHLSKNCQKIRNQELESGSDRYKVVKQLAPKSQQKLHLIKYLTAGLRVYQLGSLRRHFSFGHAHKWPLM